jgi:hypothetical protein
LDQSKVVLAIHMTNPSKVAQRAEIKDLLAAQALRDEAAQVAACKHVALYFVQILQPSYGKFRTTSQAQ